MKEMLHKEQPAQRRYAQVLKAMEDTFEAGIYIPETNGTQPLSRHSYADVMEVQKEVIELLSPFYGQRAVKVTFNQICRDKGWATRASNKAAKDAVAPKNGVDMRIDEHEQQIADLLKRVTELENRPATVMVYDPAVDPNQSDTICADTDKIVGLEHDNE